MQTSCYFGPKQCGKDDPRGSCCQVKAAQISQSFRIKICNVFLYKLTLYF
jgi:hypothetical protein